MGPLRMCPMRVRLMTPPPAPAAVIAAGLAWNYQRSRKRDPKRPVISRWACQNKKVAVPVAVAFSAWWVGHWVLYVIELPEP